MEYLKYEQSRPDHMRAMIKKAPVAYVPFGALEWHGEHGPLGLDGLKARALCELAASRTGGVVFPPVFWGAFDTMPFPFTFHFKKSYIRYLARETLTQLEGWGFMVIVMLTGHYPPTQVRLLRKEARRFNKKGGAIAFGGPEQVFAVDIEYYGDHAGMWETSMMMAISPELVDVSAMPKGMTALDRMKSYGVMGQDPSEKATPELGQKAIDHIVEALTKAVEESLKNGNDRAFEAAYKNHDQAISIFSRDVFKLAKKALDVRSFSELVRYGIWTLRNM